MRSNPISIRNGLVNTWFVKGANSIETERVKKLLFFLMKKHGLFHVVNCETVFCEKFIANYIYFYKYDNVKLYLNSTGFAKMKEQKRAKKMIAYRKFLRKNLYNPAFLKIKFLINKHFIFIIIRQYLPASCIVNYVLFRLSYKFGLFSILRYSFLKDLILVKWNSGLLIKCSGRFTRKERASHYFLKKGKTSPNTITNSITYTSKFIPLKYGVCNIKIWLHSNYRRI